MSLLKRNIVANFGGGVWTGIMNLIFVPLYIHFLGIEAYGLIGVFATLLALFALLDMGMSITLNREVARFAANGEMAQEIRDLVRTLEVPYWLIAIMISFIVVVLAPLIAYRWVNVETLSPRTVQVAIMLMGLAIAFQWPVGFYSGGLLGLEHQVLLNVINVAMSTFRGLGAVLILWLVAPTVEAYFSWQIVASVIHVIVIVFFLRRSLPDGAAPPRFRRELLLNIWRFAAGMTGIVAASTILTQLDKIVLSRILSLTAFGYYTLASVVAMSLYRFIVPVFTATFPRMTNLVALDATDEIIALYHKSAQLVSVLVLPVAVTLALFSKEILMLWTLSPVTAENAHVLVSILVMGTAIHGLMHIPYALQLAFGWTRLNLTINLVSVVLVVPLMIILTKWYGSAGAASVWVIVNVGYMFSSIAVMHRRLLPAEKWRWCVIDVGRPLCAAAAVGAIGRCIIKSEWPPVLLFVGIGVVGGGALVASACVANRLDMIARGRSFVGGLRIRVIGMGKAK